jgi:hypothetical protein
MVVDLCGMAELTRKGQTGVDVWYDIYTDWHGSYSHVGYCSEAGCNDVSHTNPKTKMIRKAENPTTINPRTGQPISSGFVFNSNNGNSTQATTKPVTDSTTTTTQPDTSVNTNTQSSTVFDSNTTNTNNNTTTNNTNTNGDTPNTNTNTNTNTNSGTLVINKPYTLQTFGPNGNNTNATTNNTNASTNTGTNYYVNTNSSANTFTPSGGS